MTNHKLICYIVKMKNDKDWFAQGVAEKLKQNAQNAQDAETRRIQADADRLSAEAALKQAELAEQRMTSIYKATGFWPVFTTTLILGIFVV